MLSRDLYLHAPSRLPVAGPAYARWTVQECFSRCRQASIIWPLSVDLSEEVLQEKLYHQAVSLQRDVPTPDFALFKSVDEDGTKRTAHAPVSTAGRRPTKRAQSSWRQVARLNELRRRAEARMLDDQLWSKVPFRSSARS